MAWFPGAERMELQPESDTQPAIVPTQLILHSIAAPWTPQRIFEYWRDSTNLESHFGLGYDGAIAQYIGTQTRADANMYANRRPDGTGAVSIETASDLQHTDPWTDAQVETLIRLGVWMHQQHGIPLRVCRTWDDPGFGYHRLFPQWSDGGTACPGDARVRQFNEVVFPGIVARASGSAPAQTTPAPPVPEEIDMTPDQIAAAPVLYRGLDGHQPPVASNVGDFLNNFVQSHARIEATQAAQSAVMQALVAQLGLVHGVDTAAVIAAVNTAVDAAVAKGLASGITLTVNPPKSS
jgi:hypothetical protein